MRRFTLATTLCITVFFGCGCNQRLASSDSIVDDDLRSKIASCPITEAYSSGQQGDGRDGVEGVIYYLTSEDPSGLIDCLNRLAGKNGDVQLTVDGTATARHWEYLSTWVAGRSQYRSADFADYGEVAERLKTAYEDGDLVVFSVYFEDNAGRVRPDFLALDHGLRRISQP